MSNTCIIYLTMLWEHEKNHAFREPHGFLKQGLTKFAAFISYAKFKEKA